MMMHERQCGTLQFAHRAPSWNTVHLVRPARCAPCGPHMVALELQGYIASEAGLHDDQCTVPNAIATWSGPLTSKFDAMNDSHFGERMLLQLQL
jgi:hypothetical protein